MDGPYKSKQWDEDGRFLQRLSLSIRVGASHKGWLNFARHCFPEHFEEIEQYESSREPWVARVGALPEDRIPYETYYMQAAFRLDVKEPSIAHLQLDLFPVPEGPPPGDLVDQSGEVGGMNGLLGIMTQHWPLKVDVEVQFSALYDIDEKVHTWPHCQPCDVNLKGGAVLKQELVAWSIEGEEAEITSLVFGDIDSDPCKQLVIRGVVNCPFDEGIVQLVQDGLWGKVKEVTQW